jgi:phosphopantothenoylcysteine decarboxylase/phosphopantothenate--cysteine ligase
MPEAQTDRSLEGRKILLGVTGGIAAYKAAALVRLFKKAGAEVQVLMTPDAARFITPLTLGTLSEREVLTEIFPENASGSWTRHITLGLWADLFIVAPATAQTLAKLAYGFSDSMLTAAALAARCPLLVCPAMDHDMYVHPATRANLERLAGYGYRVMEPGHGELASGLVGQGRLPEPDAIFARALELLAGNPSPQQDPAGAAGSLGGKTVLVTAGPTREALDPVRYLSNHSTGTMGFALARAAARRGAQVTLVSGPTALDTPSGVTRVDVVSAEEMYEAVLTRRDADLIFMAAAVADYTPTTASATKIKKTDGELVLHLRRTPDILAELGRSGQQDGRLLIGFALETDAAAEHARRKLAGKNLDWIVLNDLSEEGAGFGTTTNRVTLFHRSGRQHDLPLMPKDGVADAILDLVAPVDTPD